MSYSDPCAVDPAHGLAVVGIDNQIDPSHTSGYWVCMDCFEKWLDGKAELVRNVAAALDED